VRTRIASLTLALATVVPLLGPTPISPTSVVATPLSVTVAPPPLQLVALPSESRLWSDPLTWGGLPPGAGDIAVIDAGVTVILDGVTPALGGVLVRGTLQMDTTRDVALTAGWVVLDGGHLLAGSADSPDLHRVDVTLTGGTKADPFLDTLMQNMHGGAAMAANQEPKPGETSSFTRGIIAVGGDLELYGPPVQTPWTHLAATARAGTDVLHLATEPGWSVGDRIVVAPTDFRAVAAPEVRTVTAVSGSDVTLDQPLAQDHWGTVQTFGGQALDERAEVGDLTRGIAIQAPDDTLWRTAGFGAHVLAMTGSIMRLQGVEVRRGGQEGLLGRYPIHWHELSYAPDGTELGDAAGQFVRDSVVDGSRNRCIVTHATNGLDIERNVCSDIQGHGIFLEDGVERRTTIADNLVVGVRNPPPTKVFQRHEGDIAAPLPEAVEPLVGHGGSSAFWITNPDNTVTGNVAAGAQGNGFWLAFPEDPLGADRLVQVDPHHTTFGTFAGNVAHSNGRAGVMMDQAPFDVLGDTRLTQFESQSASGLGASPVQGYTLSGLTSYKNAEQGLWARTVRLHADGLALADNGAAGMDGWYQCDVADSLFVGNSANHAHRAGAPIGFSPAVHATCDAHDDVFANYPADDARAGGAVATAFLGAGVQKATARWTGDTFLAAFPGWAGPVGDMATDPPVFVRTPALWDPQGWWGPADNYRVPDMPFTTGPGCAPVAALPAAGDSCPGPYYGLSEWALDLANGVYDEVKVTRDDGAVWDVADGRLSEQAAPSLAPEEPSRPVALLAGHSYDVAFPTYAADPHTVEFIAENLRSSADHVVVSVQFSGAADVTKAYVTRRLDAVSQRDAPDGDGKVTLLPAATLADALASGGASYVQDKAAHRVTLVLSGGLLPPMPGPADSDAVLYQAFKVHLEDAVGQAAADAAPDCVSAYAAHVANKPRHASEELITMALDVDAGGIPLPNLDCVTRFVHDDTTDATGTVDKVTGTAGGMACTAAGSVPMPTSLPGSGATPAAPVAAPTPICTEVSPGVYVLGDGGGSGSATPAVPATPATPTTSSGGSQPGLPASTPAPASVKVGRPPPPRQPADAPASQPVPAATPSNAAPAMPMEPARSAAGHAEADASAPTAPSPASTTHVASATVAHPRASPAALVAIVAAVAVLVLPWRRKPKEIQW